MSSTVIHARMRCVHNVPQWEGASTRSVRLLPVYSADPTDPNYTYSQATPQGEITLVITNPDAYDAFVQGDVYDIMFRKV